MAPLIVHSHVEGVARLKGAFRSGSGLLDLSSLVGALKGFLNGQEQAEVVVPKGGHQSLKSISCACCQLIRKFGIGHSAHHHLLRRLVGAFDGKALAGVRQGQNPVLRPDASLSCSPKKKEAA